MYYKVKNFIPSSSILRHYSKEIKQFKPPWNILFFGTDNFSVASLKALNCEYKRKRIIDRLEVATTTKNKMNAVYKFAKEEGLRIHPWPLDTISGFHIGLVVSFGYLIPQHIIYSFPLGMLNVHASLLPRWRGAAPIIHAIAHGDDRTGVTIMTIKPRHFDIGDIVRQETVEIRTDTTLVDLHDNLARVGAKVLVEELEKLPENLHLAKPQPNVGVTLAPKVTGTFGIINWSSMPARTIYNLSRALVGLYPLFTKWNELVVKLHDVQLCNEGQQSPVRPGSVYYDRKSKLLKIQCVDGNWISVGNVGVANKRTMSSCDFNNGYMKKVEVDKRIFV